MALHVVTELSPANGAFWRGSCSAFSGEVKSEACPELKHHQSFTSMPGHRIRQRRKGA
jgi:hypothetical protein